MNRKLLFLALFPVAAHGTTISNICSSMTVAGNTATCVPIGGTPPTACHATVNGGSVVALPSAGGSAAFNVTSCAPSTVTYHWLKNNIFGVTSAAWNDSYSANAGSAVITNIYQVQVCNGGSCVNFPTAPLTVTVAGSGTTPPPASCGAFSKVINLSVDWNSPARVYSGPMSPTDLVVVTFTTGNTSNPDNNLPRIVGAEYQSPPSTRIAVLSATPCDFSAQSFAGATTSGSTVTIPFTVSNPNNYGYYPILNKNTTYYFNVKNALPASCESTGACDMAFDLSKPGGMSFSAQAAASPEAKKQDKLDRSFAKRMLQEIKDQGLRPIRFN